MDSAGNQSVGPSLAGPFAAPPSISADGRFVAFAAWARNLAPGDTNGFGDVFVHDRGTGTTERLSADRTGTEANDTIHQPAISGDGHVVAFVSAATNLVPGDTNGQADVFVHDRPSGTTERVSVNSDGAEGDGSSERPTLSADGRYVAFSSSATNLVPGDTNGQSDVFVHDRQTRLTERVSVDSAGIQGNAASFVGPNDHGAPLSADGRFVAFTSAATNLVPGDTNGQSDVFVHDRRTGTTERVSVDSAGTEANGWSERPSISTDGRFVAFCSYATNLVPRDTNGRWDEFVHDRQTHTTERVSVDSAGTEGNGDSRGASLSADGRFVAFASDANNLVPWDTNSVTDVFVRDRNSASSESSTSARRRARGRRAESPAGRR